MERAAALGETHRALVRPTRGTKATVPAGKAKAPARAVHLVEPEVERHPSNPQDGDPVFFAGELCSAPSIPLTPSNCQTNPSDTEAYTAPPSEEVDDVYALNYSRGRRQGYVANNRNPRVADYAQPSQHMRPGWVVSQNQPTDVCFECFGLGHRKPNCPHLTRPYLDPGFLDIARDNYARLNEPQRTTLRVYGRTPAFAMTGNQGQPARQSPGVQAPGSQANYQAVGATPNSRPARTTSQTQGQATPAPSQARGPPAKVTPTTGARQTPNQEN